MASSIPTAVEIVETSIAILYVVLITSLLKLIYILFSINSPNNQPAVSARFTDFHRQHWGNPLNPALTTLSTRATDLDGLELGDEEDLSSDVLPGDPFLIIFDTHFLVRAEYIRTFDGVKAIYDKDRHNRLAVVTGQPGIGKTLWIYYALRRCLGEKQPVIWYRGGEFHFFSDTGVETNSCVSRIRYPPYTWCFVDSIYDDRLPATIYDPFTKLFPIYVAAPNEECWAKLHQLRMPELMIMNPWTRAELEKAAILYPNRKSEDISERFDNAGPSALLCLKYASPDITEFYAARDAGIKWDTTQRLVAAFLDDKEERFRIGYTPRQLCVVRRSDSETWPYIVEPISAFIRHRILAQLWEWKEQERIDIIQDFSRVPGAGGMTGVLLESQYQHRFAKKIDIVAAPMFRTSNPRSRWHAALGDFSASPTLHKAQEEALVILALSISPSESRIYRSGPLAIEENIYYVPHSENEVPIDSFIVHAGHLYLFQFASGPQHSVNRGLLTTLSRFSGLPVAENRHLIFVVPKSVAKFSCSHSDDGFLRDHVPYVAQIDN